MTIDMHNFLDRKVRLVGCINEYFDKLTEKKSDKHFEKLETVKLSNCDLFLDEEHVEVDEVHMKVTDQLKKGDFQKGDKFGSNVVLKWVPGTLTQMPNGQHTSHLKVSQLFEAEALKKYELITMYGNGDKSTLVKSDDIYAPCSEVAVEVMRNVVSLHHASTEHLEVQRHILHRTEKYFDKSFCFSISHSDLKTLDIDSYFDPILQTAWQ